MAYSLLFIYIGEYFEINSKPITKLQNRALKVVFITSHSNNIYLKKYIKMC